MIYFFLAILPIAMALVLMTKFKVQPGIALPLSWTCSMLCGCIVWQLPFLDLLAVSLYGVLKSFDIILIVFCAVLLLNILKKNNAFDVINSTFGTMSADRRIQLIVIAWFFSSFIEGAAGFGSAPALVAPLLAALGFPVLIACTTALIGNTLPVPFGAVGTPTITLNSILSGNLASCGVSGEIFAKQLMQMFTDISMLSGMFLPLLLVSFMIILDGGKHKIKAIVEIIPFCFVSGIVYFIPWKLAAIFLGPELPSMVGPVCAFPVILLLLKFKPSFLIPVKAWDFKGNSQQQEFPVFEKKQIIQAWMPYFLIALLLIITRLPMLPFKAWLTAVKLSLPAIGRINGTALSWAWLYNPGVFPFLAVSFYTMFSFGIKRQNV
ncbi:MAG: L-lactate permease, partial [Lentisphaeria bacterium]|nr:L-lactate permease [Lentisphaeria bacterium]